GGSGFFGSVGITGEFISAVGDLTNATANIEVDARDKIISPGFINIHSHTNAGIVNKPGLSCIFQGITTELGGQCGSSQGPDSNGNNVGFHLYEMSNQNLGYNFATMVGHGTIRRLVLGSEDITPTAEDLQKMRNYTDEAVRQGAFGLSTGLEYIPGSLAKTPELIELAKALEPFGVPYASHMRNEDNFLLDAIDETLTVGKEAGCPVQISHLKVQGQPNWKNIDQVFEKIEKASGERGNVHFDRYPYVAYSTGLSNLFPNWSREGGSRRFVERLNDSSLEGRIKEYVTGKVNDLGSWNSVMVSSARSQEDRQYVGKRMDEIAADKGTDPFEETISMLLRNNGSVGMVGFGMSEENTERILAHPLGMICSDGSAMSAETGGSPHPRNFGAFARAVGYYCRDQKIFDLPTVVHKMTQMPAEKLQFKKRGLLQRDYYADISVFDFDTIKDTATFQDPKKYAAGVSHVLVNGKITVSNGEHTGELPGKVLRFEP
ncbi:amidohydrolase family protein, partial [candidate division KSB1 bacterium]